MTQTQTELPTLDVGTVPVKKKVPYVFLAVITLVLAATGVGVHAYLQKGEVFKKQSAKVKEPPLPTIAADVSANPVVAPSAMNDLVIGGIDVSQPTNESQVLERPDVSTPISSTQPSKEYAEIKEQIDQQLKLTKELLSELQEVRGDNQALSAAVTDLKAEVVELKASTGGLADKARVNERWLSGISNQLKSIDIDVKENNNDFPIVVYYKTVWGTDTFITVAPKDKPDQTSFLRTGDLAGKWKLVSIGGDVATFVHVDGQEKEVVLQ
jgi:hypothetical protein